MGNHVSPATATVAAFGARSSRWYLSLAAATVLCLIPLLVPVVAAHDDRLLMYPYGAAMYLLPIAGCIWLARNNLGIRKTQWLMLAGHFAMLSLALWAPTLWLWTGWPADPLCSWLITGFSAASSMFCLLSLGVFAGTSSRKKRLLDTLMIVILSSLSFLAGSSGGPSGFSQYHLQVTVCTAVFLLCCAEGARRGVTSIAQQFFVEAVEIYLVSRVIVLFLIDIVNYMWLSKPRDLPFDLLYSAPELCFFLVLINRASLQRNRTPLRTPSALWGNVLPSLTVLAAVAFGLDTSSEHPIVSGIAIFITVIAFVVRTHLLYQRMLREQQGLLTRTGQLEELATQDALTGIGNRRWLEQTALQLLEKGTAMAVSLLLIDTDRFKWINDTFGHRVGDELLKCIGEELREQLDGIEGACCARLGGDEFVVLLPRLDLDAAWGIAEHLRANLGNLRLEEASGQCSVSIGVVAVNEQLPLSGLLELADEALYRAKERGRNVVEVVSDDAITAFRAGVHSEHRRFRPAV
jgi:diguanylate cyclase (GGDEF)-like protein